MKFFLFLMLLSSQSLLAATYYVSASGNDSQSGTSTNTPWKTIDKVNQGDYNDGDIILFRRGDTFRGALDVPKAACQYGAYGLGANPIISGATVVTGWTQHNGNIYKATLNGTKVPNHLFVNGNLITIARYPNTGWLKNSALSPDKKSLSSTVLASLGKPNNYWAGANIHVRSFSWLFENRTINSSNGANVVMDNDLTETASGTINPGWGFYIDNKLSELDAPGEWFFEPNTRTVYLYGLNGGNPSSQLVEASVEDIGIKIFFKNNVKVENLTITMQKETSIQAWLSDGVTINNCLIEKSGGTGIEQPWNCKDLKITNNQIKNCLNYGIFWNEADDFNNGANLIRGNHIGSIGMVAGYGGSGVVQYCGVRTRGKNINFIKNTIDSTGYVCMLTEANNSLIEKNVFKNSQLLLDDGGALYINANNNTIRNNFFLNSFGNRNESSGLFNGSSFAIMGMGIFSQGGYSGSVIENNVFAHNRSTGLYLDNHTNATISNNLMFNNKTQMYITNTSGTKSNVNNNILYSLLPSQIALEMDNKPLDYANVFNNAFYGNAYNTNNLIKAENNAYTFTTWKTAFPGVDAAAGTSTVNFTYVDSLTAIAKHLFITNPSDVATTVDLQNKTYRQLDGSYVCGNSLTVAPWTAKLILWDDEPDNLIYNTATAQGETAANVNSCKWYTIKKSNQNLVSINPNNNNLATVTADTYLNPTNPLVLGSKSLGRSWVIKSGNAPISNVMVRFYFTTAEFNTLKALDATINTVNDLKIVKYSGPNEDNIFTNNTSETATTLDGVTFTAYQNGFYAQCEVATFSEFWIVSKISGTLPVSLTNFTAVAQQNKIRLNWQTIKEKNSSHFEIERATDNVNFEKIETIEAAKYSTVLQKYSYSDSDIQTLTGNVYYRLKMFDRDGKSENSETKVVKLSFAPLLDIKIYPNPAINSITIELINSIPSPINYSICNALGIIVLKGKYEHIDLKSHQSLDISAILPGIYFIKIVTNNTQKVLKFIKL
ncbi:MAG: T9SS C-terminal target domain-containing protein [Sphingobacteriales bacterium]|nr:MAG: T9SS C-terminal target domain-containing protein [Sphingobacteriales bacterium]TAF82223.1 MAG: T9SS C-terminal target domain-containing protein [Sphingobacteriales bacterium]